MFCILPERANAFRQALKDKTIDLKDLLDPKMTSEERTAIFRDYTGTDAEAKLLNTSFEEKLVLKNRLLGIKNLFSKAAGIGKYSDSSLDESAKAMSDYKAKQQERLFSPKENEAFLNDLVDKKMGIHIDKETAATVFKMQGELNELAKEPGGFAGVSDGYLQKQAELASFIESQNKISIPESIAQNLVIIARNDLLSNPSTPIKTAVGQAVNSSMEVAVRRIGLFSARGENPELAKQAGKEAWETFNKTGYSVTTMESMEDAHKLGTAENFKVPDEGITAGGKVAGAVEKTVRTAAKISNKIIIDFAHNKTFTKFHQKAFYDMSNLVSSKFADDEGLKGAEAKQRAADIFKDAARIEPQTAEGMAVRTISQRSAARVTSTNDTYLARLAIGTKNVLNKVIPGVPLGDFIVPIAKVPANIIVNGLENAGIGIPLGIKDIWQGHSKMQSEDLSEKYEGMAQYAQGIQTVIRTVGTIAGAALIASQFTAKDFKEDQYGASYIKIGNIWVNMEYISAISPALSGMLFGKAHPKLGKVDAYVTGALKPLLNAPGTNELHDLITSVTSNDAFKGIEKYASTFFTERGEPSIISNLFKSRPIDRILFGANGVESTQDVTADNKAAAKKAAATRKANAAAK